MRIRVEPRSALDEYIRVLKVGRICRGVYRLYVEFKELDGLRHPEYTIGVEVDPRKGVSHDYISVFTEDSSKMICEIKIVDRKSYHIYVEPFKYGLEAILVDDNKLYNTVRKAKVIKQDLT